MSQVKTVASVATLIGDVVRSRSVADRAELHERLAAVLDEANRTLEPVVPLRVTVGDEYQGCFATVGAAVHATLWLRLRLAPETDLRHGLGWGEVTVLSERPRVEDGPGWWAARAAIEWVKQQAATAGARHLRTAYRRAADLEDPAPEDPAPEEPDREEPDRQTTSVTGPAPDPVNAALLCRDHMIGSVSERSLRLLRGTLDGRTQAEMAAEEGISPSAVSQRVRHDGLAVVVAADELIRRVQ